MFQGLDGTLLVESGCRSHFPFQLTVQAQQVLTQRWIRILRQGGIIASHIEHHIVLIDQVSGELLFGDTNLEPILSILGPFRGP